MSHPTKPLRSQANAAEEYLFESDNGGNKAIDDDLLDECDILLKANSGGCEWNYNAASEFTTKGLARHLWT
jgi:hypothetical protein